MQWSYGLDVDALDRPGHLQRARRNGRAAGARPSEDSCSNRPVRPSRPGRSSPPRRGQALVGRTGRIQRLRDHRPATRTSRTTTGTSKAKASRSKPAPRRRSPTRSPKPGVYNVILKVIDSDGQEETTSAHGHRRKPRSAPALAASPNPAAIGQKVTFDASASSRRGRPDHRLQVGPRRQRQIRNRHRLHARPSRPASRAPAHTRWA